MAGETEDDEERAIEEARVRGQGVDRRGVGGRSKHINRHIQYQVQLFPVMDSILDILSGHNSKN